MTLKPLCFFFILSNIFIEAFILQIRNTRNTLKKESMWGRLLQAGCGSNWALFPHKQGHSFSFNHAEWNDAVPESEHISTHVCATYLLIHSLPLGIIRNREAQTRNIQHIVSYYTHKSLIKKSTQQASSGSVKLLGNRDKVSFSLKCMHHTSLAQDFWTPLQTGHGSESTPPHGGSNHQVLDCDRIYLQWATLTV